MRWMICWNDGIAESHPSLLNVIFRLDGNKDGRSQQTATGYRDRVLAWLHSAKLGDVLEFPLGIVVRTSEHATEIGYDREETGS